MRALRTVVGYVLAATALIACPCHLVLLLPLVLGLLGGTALGVALAAHTGWVIVAATVYFVGAFAGGIYVLSRRARDEDGNPTPSFGRGGRCPSRPGRRGWRMERAKGGERMIRAAMHGVVLVAALSMAAWMGIPERNQVALREPSRSRTQRINAATHSSNE